MSNDKTHKAKPAEITITDAMTIVNAFNNRTWAYVQGTKGLELSIHCNMKNGLDYAILRICGLSFHSNNLYETRIETESGKLCIYGREIIDVPIKGMWEEAEKRHNKMVEEEIEKMHASTTESE